ncbi:MAG: pseudouridine synthase [Candidatus Heimdallarchaeota archaeon]|nr:pseudouridine synthase [Candidatus Heimdallarchaeota archaeon]
MAAKRKGEEPSNWTIRVLRTVAQYQFGPEFDQILVPEGVTVTFSPKTSRVREIIFQGKRIATKRATDGMFSLGLFGAQRIIDRTPRPKRRVVILSEVGEFIAAGRNVFAKHVVAVDSEIKPEEEVVVVSEEDQLLAVGRAQLSAENMLAFERGVAVKVRYGINKLKK